MTACWDRLALVVAIATTAWAFPACASGLTVSEPTIVGPPGPVNHVTHGGFDGGYDWVSAQGFGEPEVDGALWEAEPLTPGPYEVEAWIPNEFGTADARYKILHEKTTSEVLVSQYEVESGAWVKLGAYEFNAEGASVRSTDAAGDPGDRIDWSDMRWTPIASLPLNIETIGTTTTVREPGISGSDEFVSRFAGVGYDESLWVASAQGTEASPLDTATWAAPLASGEYTVQVYIPESHREAEVGYTIHAEGGDRSFSIIQPDYENTWVTLGHVRFKHGTAEVTSSDATGDPEENIAWSALRFVQIVAIPEIEPEPEPESLPPVATSPVAAPDSAPESAHFTPLAQTPPSTERRSSKSLLPLVVIQHKLLRFDGAPLISRVGGPTLGRNYSFRIVRAEPKPKDLTLRYRCSPCLLVRREPQLQAGSQAPVTRLSHAAGLLSELIGRLEHKGLRLFQGSVLRIEVVQVGHRPRIYLYRLPNEIKVKSPIECGQAATVKVCTP